VLSTLATTPRLPMLATPWGLSRQYRQRPGRPVAVDRADLVQPRRAPGPRALRAVFAPDPLSGGMLYYSYSPPAPSYGGPIPRDPTGTRYSQTWLWHDGRFTKESRRGRPPGTKR
jgi:hypothetical protein